jgi:hypothetical protein
MKKSIKCFNCEAPLEVLLPVGRREECGKCRADVHVCKNCEFYDAKAYNECRESSADVVKEKDRSNFCDYFSPGAKGSGEAKKQDLMSAAEALFKKRD